jgi:gliding motility-associated lipoprotein GldD
MNITFPEYNAAVYLSYKEINAKHNLSKLIEDAHTLTYRHSIKADYIDEGTIKSRNNVYGLYYDVGGNAASNIQFFVTDSVKNFIRGSLYFNNEPNADSLAPVINFVRKDIEHMISTLKWK